MYLQLTESASAWIWFGEVDVWFEEMNPVSGTGPSGMKVYLQPPLDEPFWLVASNDIANGDVFVFINPTGEPSDGGCGDKFHQGRRFRGLAPD